MTPRSVAAIAALGVLAGCAGPAAERPPAAAVTVPPVWRETTAPGAAVELAWWRSYGDAALSALVEQAVHRNSDVAVAAARVAEARAQLGVARARLLPSLDLNVSAGRARRLNSFGTPGEANSFSTQFQAAYEVDLFGRSGDLVGAAGAAMHAGEAARDALALSVAATAAQSYIALRALDARLAVARETLRSRADALRLAQSRFRQGYGTRLEVEQAQAEYDATAEVVPQTELAVVRQENAIGQLVGDPSGAVARGAGIAALALPAVSAGLPAEVLRRRPDIAQAEYQLAASDARLVAARKAFLPRIDLAASLGKLAMSGLPANPNLLWSVGGSVLAPIFDGGRLEGEMGVATAQRDQAAFAYRKTVLNAFREVNDNLTALRTLDVQRAHVAARRDALSQALHHAVRRYQAGYSPYLEQLDAQRNLFNAELSLIQVRADQLNASVALYLALGGGWQQAPR